MLVVAKSGNTFRVCLLHIYEMLTNFKREMFTNGATKNGNYRKIKYL